MLKSVIVNSKRSGTDFNCFSFDSEFNGPECLIDILLSDHSFVRSSSTYLPVTLLGAKDKRNKKKFLKPGICEVERKLRLLKLCHFSDPRSLFSLSTSVNFSESSFVSFIMSSLLTCTYWEKQKKVLLLISLEVEVPCGLRYGGNVHLTKGIVDSYPFFLLWKALFQMTVVSLNICWNLPVKPLDLRLAGWLVLIRRYLRIYAFIKTVIFYFILS